MDSFIVRCALFCAGITLSMMFFSSIFDFTPRCVDGWRSPSIGTQGACSHHGGVASTGRGLAFLASIAIGVVAYRLPTFFARQKATSPTHVPKPSPPTPSPLYSSKGRVPANEKRPVDTRTPEEIKERNEYYAKMSAEHVSEQVARIKHQPMPPAPKKTKKRKAKSSRLSPTRRRWR